MSDDSVATSTIRVVAAALFDPEGRVLLAQRPPGKSSAGRWEFPGGKLEPGEALAEALRRELAEELGIDVLPAACQPLLEFVHRQGERNIQLSFFKVLQWRGDVRGIEGQRLEWVWPRQLKEFDILDADRPFIEFLQGVTAHDPSA